jgi:hypothetical protein
MMNIKSSELIDINKEYTASIEEFTYDVSSTGNIIEKSVNQSTGQLIWNKELNYFSLK